MDGNLRTFSGQQEQPYLASTVDKQRYAEQVALLYRNGPLAYVITLACAFLLSWEQRTFISADTLRVWFLCVLLLTAARSILTHRYFHTRPALDEAPRWGRYYLIATALSGMLWGSAALFLFPAESTTHQVVVALVLAGMCAGAVPILSSVRAVFWVFMLPALLPLAVRLFTAGTELTTVLGVITLIFIVGMLISAQRMNRSIINSLSLRFENQALFVHLERDKAKTDRLNGVLRAQIAERTRAEQALRARESQLQELTDELEQRVAARTQELRSEIEERKRAENTLRQRSRALEQSGSTVLIVDRNL